MTQNPKYLISFRVLVCRGGRTVADIHLNVGDTVSLTQRGPAHWSWKDVWHADIASQLNETVKGRKEPDLSSEELADCTILEGPLLKFFSF